MQAVLDCRPHEMMKKKLKPWLATE